MGNLSRVALSVETRESLLRVLESVELFLLCGFDFSYAWRESLSGMEPAILRPSDEAAFGDFLQGLAENRALYSTAPWWVSLRALYEVGGPILETLGAFTRHLREERAREIERFANHLPLRLHLRLLLFFVPATLFLLFYPMLRGLFQVGFQSR